MKVHLDSVFTELSRARRLVREATAVLTNKTMAEESVEQLELAVTEAVANVIRHSYDGESGHRIEFVVEGTIDGIEVKIHHWGKSFRPAKIPEPVFDGTSESGFGLFIISRCVDFFDYSTDKQNRNTIRLIKKIKN
jgi:anti-sigma regulatory factor (Ser/Thr protein kinase)